jgi:hypothetical protein
MRKQLAYIIGGVFILYIIFKSSKFKNINNKDKNGNPNDIVEINNQLLSSLDFKFFYKQEEDAFITQYIKQYDSENNMPKNGDIIVIYWGLPEKNIERKSTFQFMDNKWRRFANFAKIQSLKTQKWISLKNQK